MEIVKVIYVKNIETALKQYLKLGYKLWLLENSAEVELRMNLWHPTQGSICLARQWWDEMYPETKDEGLPMPVPHVEYKAKSEEEYQEYYMKLKNMGLVYEVEGHNLTDVPLVRLKESSSILVHPDGYTWG